MRRVRSPPLTVSVGCWLCLQRAMDATFGGATKSSRSLADSDRAIDLDSKLAAAKSTVPTAPPLLSADLKSQVISTAAIAMGSAAAAAAATASAGAVTSVTATTDSGSGGGGTGGGSGSGSASGRGLVGVFYSEFDNILGPKITYQTPKGFLRSEVFDEVSDFIITCPELCHKLITFTHHNYTILGYPIALSNNKYHRNALLFNVGFVFDTSPPPPGGGGTTTPPAYSDGTAFEIYPYQSVLRKLACMLETVEIESEFLFRADTKPALQPLIEQILSQLNASGECTLTISRCHVMWCDQSLLTVVY